MENDWAPSLARRWPLDRALVESAAMAIQGPHKDCNRCESRSAASTSVASRKLPGLRRCAGRYRLPCRTWQGKLIARASLRRATNALRTSVKRARLRPRQANEISDTAQSLGIVA